MVTRLDRLARSTRDLLNILDTISKARRRLQVVGRHMGRYHDRTGPPDADYPWRACRVRRELILARTGDGRRRAQGAWGAFWTIQRLAEGATQADLARTYGVSQATISRLQPSPFEVASVGAG